MGCELGHLELILATDGADLGHHQVDLARAQAIRQLLPRTDHDVGPQVRVLRAQLADRLRHEGGAAIRPGADAELAGFEAAGQREIAFDFTRGEIDFPGMFDEQVPELRGLDLALVAIEQRHPERRLQRLDAAAQRRLADMQRLRCAQVVAGFGQGQHVTELSEVHEMSSAQYSVDHYALDTFQKAYKYCGPIKRPVSLA